MKKLELFLTNGYNLTLTPTSYNKGAKLAIYTRSGNLAASKLLDETDVSRLIGWLISMHDEAPSEKPKC